MGKACSEGGRTIVPKVFIRLLYFVYNAVLLYRNVIFRRPGSLNVCYCSPFVTKLNVFSSC